MKTKLTIAFLLCAFCLFAQNTDDFERLHSKNLEQSLYVSFDGDHFFYKSELSNDEKGFLQINNGQTKRFQIGNDDENTLQIFIEFYNPLTHKVTSTAAESDDENFKALSEFIENLSSNVGDFAEVNDVDLTENSPFNSLSKTKKKRVINEAIYNKASSSLASMYSKSPFMNDWVVKFKSGIIESKGSSKIFTDSFYYQKFEAVVNTINGMEAIEDFLYRDIDNSDKNVVEYIKVANEELRKVSVNDLASFKEKLKESKEIEAKLSQALQTAKTNFNNIKNLLKNDEVAITGFFTGDLDFKNEFHTIHNSKIVYLDAILADKMKKHETAIAKLKELNEKLTNYCEAYENDKYPEGFKRLEEDAFGFQFEKKRSYELVGVKLNENGDEIDDSKVTTTFVVRKSQGRLAVFTSLGMFYTPFEYKNYGLAEGLVAETQGDPVYFRPALYLNFLYRLRQGDIFYPMFQVGITQGIKTPMFPIGVGFTIRDKFSVTFGPLLAFQRELDKLEIGAMTDDATLQDDLESRIKASFYISINFRL